MRKKKPQTKTTVTAATIVDWACNLMIAAAFVIMSITMYNLINTMIQYGAKK